MVLEILRKKIYLNEKTEVKKQLERKKPKFIIYLEKGKIVISPLVLNIFFKFT